MENMINPEFLAILKETGLECFFSSILSVCGVAFLPPLIHSVHHPV